MSSCVCQQVVAVHYPCVHLLCIAEQGVFLVYHAKRYPPPWCGFGGPVWPFAASLAVFLGHPASRLHGLPSPCPYFLRVYILLVGRLCLQDGGVEFLGAGIVRLEDRAYMLALVQWIDMRSKGGRG